MDCLANSFIRKWLGLPRCLSDVGLWQEPTTTATAIHQPGIQAGESPDGAGAEGIQQLAPKYNPPPFWSKTSKEERRAMVVAEVTRTEQERLNIKAVLQRQQGGWMSWSDMWKIPQARLGLLIRPTYDTHHKLW